MRRKAQGFTLVELMMSIGIIAMLVSILLPAVNRAREQANQVACLSNLRQLAAAFIMYTQEDGGWLPRDAHYTASTLPESPQDFLWWQQASTLPKTNRDVFNSPIMRCLGFRPDSVGRTTVTDFNESRQRVLRCPSDPLWDHPAAVYSNDHDGNYYYSYTLNDLMQSLDPNSPNDANFLPLNEQGGRYAVAGKLTNVRHPALKILLVDEATATIDDGAFDPTGATELLSIRHDHTAVQPADTPTGFILLNGVWTVRNGECRGNVAFCDGHADFVTRNYVNQPNYKLTSQLATCDPYY
jgi:prepilin-type N-terminal cleavage/methylation domain-containing protein/prepilin-type processing-associated H-X9-DG protein